MTVNELREKLRGFPDDMKVVGLGKACRDFPSEVFISEGFYDPEESEWTDIAEEGSEAWKRRERVCVIEVYN